VRERRRGCVKPGSAALQRRRGERVESHGVLLLESAARWRRFARSLDRVANRLARLPRHAGLIATILIIAASAGYGAALSGQAGKIIDFFKDVRNTAANAAGFNIAAVAVAGERHLSREEILAAAGVTGRTSLLFFDVADARARLLTNPWIAEATVQKFLPDRLAISISERVAFALWQKAGRVGVIASDGTVLEPYALRRYADLPLVVGTGAETRAREFLALLDPPPRAARAGARLRFGGRAALEPQTEERRRCPPAGIRRRAGVGPAGRIGARHQAVEPRHHRD